MIKIALKLRPLLDCHLSVNQIQAIDAYLGEAQATLKDLVEQWQEPALANVPMLITGYTITGHAGQAAYGNDVICAAITTLAATCIGGLQELAAVVELDYQLSSGEINCQLVDLTKLTPEQLVIAEILLTNFCLGCWQVQQSEQAQTGNYLKLTIAYNR